MVYKKDETGDERNLGGVGMKLRKRFVTNGMAIVLLISLVQAPMCNVNAEEIIQVTERAAEATEITAVEAEHEEEEIVRENTIETTVSENAADDSEKLGKDLGDVGNDLRDEMDDSIQEEGEASDPIENIEEEIENKVEKLDAVSEKSNGDIASGSYRNEEDGSDITWRIDANGKLTVAGKGNFVSSEEIPPTEHGDWNLYPWLLYRDRIRSAEINVTGTTNAAGMFLSCTNLSSVDLLDFDTSSITDMSSMFAGCSSLSDLDLDHFDTSKVTDMSSMFAGCGGLSNLNISHFDTANVTEMIYMFSGCSGLSNLDINHFNTSKVTDMQGMFSGCSKLKELNLSGLYTRNVTCMAYMFEKCDNLAELDLSSFDTKNLVIMDEMFSGCKSLTSLDLSNFNLSNLEYEGNDVFKNCESLAMIHTPYNIRECIFLPLYEGYMWYEPDGTVITELPQNQIKSVTIIKKIIDTQYDIASGEYRESGSDITWRIDINGKLIVEGIGEFADSKNGRERAPWYNKRLYIKTAEINVKNMTDASYMFENCRNLKYLDVSGFDVSQVTNMQGMFWDCESLQNIDLSSFDTSNVTNMSDMFRMEGANGMSSENYVGPISINVSSFNTKNVTDMSSMFGGCGNLLSLDISNFDTSNVTDMSDMFFACDSLTDLDVSGFDTSKVKNMSNMFSSCIGLKSLDVSNFNTSNVTDMSDMFSICNSLTSINVSSFNTSNVTNMRSMFSQNLLTSLDVSGFDTSKVTNMSFMFHNCRNLKYLDVSGFNTSQVTDMSFMFFDCGQRGISLDVGNFDTSRVTDMTSMFQSCGASNLDVSNFDTSNVICMKWMFASGLVSVDLSGLNTSNVKDMSYMFCGCNKLTELNLSSFDLAKAARIESMFELCKALNVIYTPMNLNQVVELPRMEEGDIWYDIDGNTYTELPRNLDHSIALTKNEMPAILSPHIKLKKTKIVYEYGEKLNIDDLIVTYYNDKGIPLSVKDYVTNANEIDMYTLGKKILIVTYNDGADELTAELELTVTVKNIELNKEILTLGKGETDKLCAMVMPEDINDIIVTWTSSDSSVAKVEDGVVIAVAKGECMITASVGDKSAVCSVIVTTDQSEDDIVNGSYGNVRWIIDRDGKLIVEGSGDFSDSDSVYRAPWYTKRTGIKSAEINLKDITNVAYMFYGCENLKSLDLSHFDTENVTTMEHMFLGCCSLTSLDLGSFDTRNVIVMDGMFEGCGSLESLNLSSFDAASVTRSVCFFDTCPKLSTIYTPYNLEQSVELPKQETSDTWYDTDGNTYTELPQNLNHSIVITKNQKPVISAPHISLKKAKTVYALGEELNIDDLTVNYYNDMGIPSTVVDYASNADEIDMSTLGVKTLVITYHDLTATIEITVTENGQVEEAIGLGISFKNAQDKESVYTGKSITPPIKVTYNGRILTEGSNYTVKYSNNIKVGTAKITVTGKGNFRSSKSEEFKIVQSDINRAELAGIDEDGSLVVASGSKFAPVIYCDGRKLTNKDYKASGTISIGKKLLDSDNGKPITIEGKGNYTGNKEFTLKVVNKSSLTKFTVSLDKNKLNNLTYDGKEHYIHDIEGALTVVGKDGNTDMKRGMDYTIIYPNNVTDAGVKKFTVVGLGRYTGTVSKSYTIKPAAQTAGEIKVEYEGGNVENIKLPFISTGVTFNDRLTVTYTKNGNLLVLKEGKDYKISYAGNKKVGNKAKFTISFLGNYKGNKKQTRTFTIEKGNLEDAKVIVADKVYKGKAGIYKSAPYVIEPGTNKLLAASNYNVTYYTDEFRNVEMKGKNKVAVGDTVYVRIEAKRNGNYKTDNPIIKTYKVLEAIDLSKSKITFLDTATGVATKKSEYTGNPITDREIKVMVNGKSVDEDEDIVVTYVNNINKGKATVIITGTGETGCKYIGSKTATFNIVAYSLR